jgi:nucleoid-associated protein YgaU
MALEKLKIKPLSPSQLEEITVLFNPNSYSVDKTVTWRSAVPATGSGSEARRSLNAPPLEFGGGGSRQLTLELFFDVTESGDNPATLDVRNETNKMVALTRIERDLPHPPVCEVSWGDAPTDSDFPFTGVVKKLTQRFTLFESNGRPVRANLTAIFIEFLDPEQDQRRTDPELTTRIVKRGDTLSGIAAAVYRDPSLWRIIAEANRLDDPRRLKIGRSLTIPKLS